MDRWRVTTTAILAFAAPLALADSLEIAGCEDQPTFSGLHACQQAWMATQLARLAAELREAERRRADMSVSPASPTGPSETHPEQNSPKTVFTVSFPPEHMLRAWTTDAEGRTILTLDDDEIWRVDDSRPVPLALGKKTRIAIVGNSLGTFHMAVNGGDDRFLVSRPR